jgi:hypothetical protein
LFEMLELRIKHPVFAEQRLGNVHVSVSYVMCKPRRDQRRRR